MSTAQKIIAATSGAAGPAPVDPIGIDFDGTNDYLAKTSDLTNNADGKTFTFSAFFYLDSTADSDNDAIYGSNNSQFQVIAGASSKNISMFGKNSSSGTLLNVTSASNVFALNTWNHVLISMDLANTSNRYMYVNDQNITSGVTFTTYSNGNIDFTRNDHGIAAVAQGGSAFNLFKGRLGGVYLDYTYRDLSTTSNRRLFIDADGLYVTPPTNSIISVPMDDADDVGRNDGTGGDFTLNGVVAQSGRGPNQYNAAASTFDGSADYLSKGSITGAADGKEATISLNLKLNTSGSGFDYAFSLGESGSRNDFSLLFEYSGSTAGFILEGFNAANSSIVKYTAGTSTLAVGKVYSIQIAFDLTNTSNRAVLIDGVDAGGTWNTYTNDDVDFTQNANNIGASAIPNYYLQGDLSDFWFNDSYIDLSSSNPFYDTDTSKPKNLGGDGSTPTGSSPLVYLPLRGNDAGNNKGTGGDFTVNSGPYTGARGPSEFWGECAEFNGSDQYLYQGSLSGISDSKVFTFAASIYLDGTSSESLFTKDSTTSSTYGRFRFNISGSGLFIQVRDSSDTMKINLGIGSSMSGSTWLNILVCFDSSSQSNCKVYVNGTDKTITFNTWTADYTIPFSSEIPVTKIGANLGSNTTGNYYDGRIGFLFFDPVYTDLTQEATRLKFFDAFNYPVDLGSNGSNPYGSQPLIYINKGFHSGTNLGSAGNFTAYGTPTDGGYVRG